MTKTIRSLMILSTSLALTAHIVTAQQYPMVEGGPSGEGGERIYNFVRCVRDM